jgi:hypothetical protein
MENEPLMMQLRLDSINEDSVGFTATFFGKPDIKGNQITVPVSDETAASLVVGGQYLFYLVGRDR